MKILIKTVLLFTTICLSLYSEIIEKSEIEFKHILIKDGLSQNTVVDIFQDRYGYMWFGTQDGLNRYNSNEFKIYKHSNRDPNSIQSSIVRRIIESTDGELWIGTNNGGLSRFRRSLDDFENFTFDPDDKYSLSDKNVFALFEDSKQNIWAGTLYGGLNKFVRSSKKFIRYKFDPEDPKTISSNSVRALFEDSEGILWVGNNTGGLNKFYQKHSTFDRFCYSQNGNFNDDKVMTIFEYKPGVLLIGTDGDGIKVFNSLSNKYTNEFDDDFPQFLKNGRIRSFYRDDLGTLWISTYGDGLFTVKKDQNNKPLFENITNNSYKKESLSNNKVLNIYKSNEGLMLFGTIGGGINILDTEHSLFKNYNALDKTGLSTNFVRSVFQDSDGTLLIGTDSKGLNILTETIRYNISDFGNNRIYSVLRDSTKRMWVGTYGTGIYYSDKGLKHFSRYIYQKDRSDSLHNSLIRVIFEDREKVLWFGTGSNGLHKFNRKDEKFIRYVNDKTNKKSISSNHIRAISEDKSGDLWVGTWEGLNRFDKKKDEFNNFLKTNNDKNSLNNDHILSVLNDKNGIVWVGTWGGGLNRFDPDNNTWESYTESDGFANNVIYAIMEEKNEKSDPVLWMSSNHGIIRYDTLNRSIKIYDTTSGVQSDEFNGGAFFQNEKGKMFFGGINGLTKFNPSLIRDNLYSPKVIISGIKVFNKYKKFSNPVEDIKEIELEFGENYFMIEFILMSYRSSDKNTYRYKLDGFDKNWIESGEKNNAGYTNLEGGNYTFLVKGANNDGVWSDEITELKIRVIPPFWKTFWFKAVFAFFVLFIFLFYNKLRTRKLKKEKVQLEKTNLKLNKEIFERKKAEEEKERLQEQLIQSEKMKTLGTLAGGVAHDLNNILGAIVSYPDILLMKLPKNSTLRKPVLTMQQSGKKAAAVVKDLLTLARRGVNEKKILNLNRIIIDLLKSPEIESIKKENPEIVFDLNLDEGLHNVEGSEVHISKSLINLILNSAEAIEVNGKVFISTTNVFINDDNVENGTVLKSGQYAVVSILDNGEGIAQEDIKRIFEPFYTKKKMGRSGTGLGMAVISGMVTDHGGKIDIWSSIGTGTSFDLYLPSTVAKAKKIDNNKKIDKYLGNKEIILVIDDVLLQREIAITLLEELNYIVVTAASGEEALKYLAKNSVDLVLLDMIMEPGIDGLTTYKRIIEINKTQKVIIASGFSKPERVEEAIGLGVDEYLGKPYTIDVLGKMIHQVLGKN